MDADREAASRRLVVDRVKRHREAEGESRLRKLLPGLSGDVSSEDAAMEDMYNGAEMAAMPTAFGYTEPKKCGVIQAGVTGPDVYEVGQAVVCRTAGQMAGVEWDRVGLPPVSARSDNGKS